MHQMSPAPKTILGLILATIEPVEDRNDGEVGKDEMGGGREWRRLAGTSTLAWRAGTAERIRRSDGCLNRLIGLVTRGTATDGRKQRGEKYGGSKIWHGGGGEPRRR